MPNWVRTWPPLKPRQLQQWCFDLQGSAGVLAARHGVTWLIKDLSSAWDAGL